MADELEVHVTILSEQLGQAINQTGRLVELVAELADRADELGRDVAELGRRLTLLELAIAGADSRRERGDAELHTRITEVHTEAIKELTRKANGGTTA